LIIVSLSSVKGLPAEEPPDPAGITRFSGVRARPITVSPFLSAWYTHSDEVRPEAPNTAIVFMLREEEETDVEWDTGFAVNENAAVPFAARKS